MADEGDGKPAPRWARYQLVGAFLAGVLGVVLWIVQPIVKALFRVDLDFGALPWGLAVIGAYVIFGIKLQDFLRGRNDRGDQP